MKEYEVHKIKVDGGETIAYRDSKTAGNPILLVHGNMSSSVHFQPLIEELEKNYRVFALDLPGFGDSTYHQRRDRLEDYSKVVNDFIQEKELKELILLGWSTGGGIVLETAAKLPNQIKQVVLLNSVGIKGYKMYAKDENFQLDFTKRIYKREDIEVDPVQVAPVLEAYKTNNRDFLKQVWNAAIYHLNQPSASDYEIYLDAVMKQRNLVDIDVALANFNISHESNGVVDGSGKISDIKSPVLILHGEKDLVVPVNDSREATEAFGDQAELVIFEEAGHSVITDNLDALVNVLEEKLIE